MVGIVTIRHEFQLTEIDVEFMNKQFHKNITLTDTFGATMASINYNGLLLASEVPEQNVDEYEEIDDVQDQAAQRRKNSNIEFRPFNEWAGQKTWNYMLRNGESIECLAMGSGWCCALTNFN